MTRTFVPAWMAAALLALGAATAQAQMPAAGQQAATPAQAASAGAHGHPHQANHRHGDRGPRMDPAQREQHRAQRVAAFKDKLKLSAAQQSAWDRYQAALKPPARPDASRDAFRAEREQFAKMTTPQRIDARQKRHDEMAAHMKARGDATKAFYAQLNAEQQQVFDAETARAFDHRGPRKPHGPGHPGHHPHGEPGQQHPGAPKPPTQPGK